MTCKQEIIPGVNGPSKSHKQQTVYAHDCTHQESCQFDVWFATLLSLAHTQNSVPPVMFTETSSAGFRVSDSPYTDSMFADVSQWQLLPGECLPKTISTELGRAHRNHKPPICNWTPEMRCAWTCGGVPKRLSSRDQSSCLPCGAHRRLNRAIWQAFEPSPRRNAMQAMQHCAGIAP